MKRYFEFIDDNSNKFWEIEVTNLSYTVRFGKIGSTGQIKKKDFSSQEEALKEAESLIDEKQKKGYQSADESKVEKKIIDDKKSNAFSDFRTILLDKFKYFLPISKKIEWLGISESPIKIWSKEKYHLGVIDFYSLLNDKNNHLVFCITPFCEPENYPVAIYSSGNNTIDKIASSIKTWLPCYIVYYLNIYLLKVKNRKNYGKEYVKKSRDFLEGMINNKELILKYLKHFPNEDFFNVMPEIFSIIENCLTDKEYEWDYLKYHTLADGKDSCLSKFMSLKKNQTDGKSWFEFIKANPDYNEPLFYSAFYGNKSNNMYMTHDIAVEFYARRIFYERLEFEFKKPARLLNKNISPDHPFAGLIKTIMENGEQDKISDSYFQAGELNEINNNYQIALTCYENALWFQSQKYEGGFSVKSFEKMKSVAEKTGEKNYLDYLTFLSEKIELDKSELIPFEKLFGNFIIDTEKLTCLDLNWNHSLTDHDINVFSNFGMRSIYSIGGSGHIHLVYFLIPDRTPENYPIAIYDEEAGTGRIISASIKNWFLSFLINHVNEMLRWSWDHKYIYENEFDSLLEYKDKINDICRQFDNDEFIGILPDVIKVIEERQTKDHPLWNFEKFYMIAERKSYIGEYINLKTTDAPLDKIIDFIRGNRFYNKPLCDLLDNGELTSEAALAVLGTLFAMDFQDPASTIKKAATKLLDDKTDSGVYSGIIRIASEGNNINNAMFNNEFYNIGEILLRNKNHIEALTAYINAIKFKSMEEELFDVNSFNRIEEISGIIGDEYFHEYVKEYRKYVPGEDEE